MRRLVFLTALISGGCLPTHVSPVSTVQEVQWTNQDDDVVALVLSAFLSEKSTFDVAQKGDSSVVIVGQNSDGPSFYLSVSQISADLNTPGWSEEKELTASIIARNTKPVSLRDRTLGNRTVIEDLSGIPDGWDYTTIKALQKKHPNADRFVTLWMPGYNKDQTRAIVRFWFGPTPHGATATYLLTKKAGKWTVQKHRFAYYA
ncbi:MAG: hypothetical protein K8R88_05920 [Armatimonadetes bacterium]|nr:hypothetical protein [Armatimonadota bacterium]